MYDFLYSLSQSFVEANSIIIMCILIYIIIKELKII